MMSRAIPATTGILSAAAMATVEVATASSLPVTIVWSALAGAVGAGIAWGAMRGSVKSAHKRITETEDRIKGEKADREKSVAELKADMIRGFGEIRTDLREQTRTVLEAIDRGPR